MIKNTLVSHTNKAFQIYAKFKALKACEAESNTSMHFFDSVHAKTIIQSKKGGKKYFHLIGYALGHNLAKFKALKACEAESMTSMNFLPPFYALNPEPEQERKRKQKVAPPINVKNSGK